MSLRIINPTRNERIATDRLERAVLALHERTGLDRADLREFARSVALVAVTALTGIREDPEDAVELMTGGERYQFTSEGRQAALRLLVVPAPEPEEENV